MFTSNKMMFFGAVIVALLAYADAFFLNWGGSHEEQKQQVYAYPVSSIYQQRYAQQQFQPQQQQQLQQLNGNPNVEQQGSSSIPAIPIQVPLQSQFAPVQNLHNVQLVPCLCPVSPNVEYDRVQEQQ